MRRSTSIVEPSALGVSSCSFSSPQETPSSGAKKGVVGWDAPPHLRREFGDYFTNEQTERSAGSCDFYDTHSLLCLSPRARKNFFVKKDASGAPESVTTAPSPLEEEEIRINTLAGARVYSLRYPQSLYGPFGEVLPKLAAHHLNHPMSTHANSSTAAPAVPPSRKSSTVSGPIQAEGSQREERTLFQLAEASLTSSTTRNFGEEWAAALTMQYSSSLSAMSCRFAQMKRIAEEFAAAVSPVACAIIETRNQTPSQRPYRPLPATDNVYIVKGHVYVVSETSARIKLFGSQAAASRAADNEIRAVRTLLGNPFLGVHTPLCCGVCFMGYHVFVSAPLPLALNPEESLLCGAFKSPRVAIAAGSVYTSHKLGEYVPLLRHSLPESLLPDSAHAPAPEAMRTLVTACDVKQVYNPHNGATYVVDAARYLPPAVCQTREYSKVKTKDDGMGAKGVARHPLEDEPLAYLSVQFRPEFMRHSCPIQLNADANTPHQSLNSQDSIGHAIYTLYNNNTWQVLMDLVSAEQSKTLAVGDVSTVFHKHGVNLRYMGKVYGDLDTAVKSNDIREAIKYKLAVEAACRAFKTVVFNKLAAEIRFRAEEQTIVSLFRHLLLCCDQSSNHFWEHTLLPVMQTKFGFSTRVARETASGGTNESRDAGLTLQDTSGLNVYKCISNVKRRIERVVPSLNWTDVGGGYVALDSEGIERLRRQNEDALSVLYPLLGKNARENSDLLVRAQQLIHVDISSDLRGKKIIVQFRPRVKPCTPLILSPSLQVVASQGPADVQSMLGQTSESASFCEAVEACCRAELQAISKISESDPRATLPLQVLSLSFSGRFMFPQSFMALNRCFELRKSVPIDAVTGGTCLDLAQLYAKAPTADRAETLCVDGLSSLRNSNIGVDIQVFVDALLTTARVVIPTLTADGSTKMPLERTQRVLEYLSYACYLSETFQLPTVVEALSQIGFVRKKLAASALCFRCNRQAELVAKGDFDQSLVEKMTSEKDAASIGSKPVTATTAAATTLGQTKNRAQVPAHRRKKEEQRKDDDDVAEVFAKKTIDRIQLLYLDGVGGPTRIQPLAVAAAAGVNGAAPTMTSVASSVNLAALANAAASVAQQQSGEAQDVPICAALSDFPRPSTVCKMLRYTCKTCSAKHPAPEKEPIMREVAAIFNRVSSLGMQSKGHQSLDKNIVGEALLQLGTLELHPQAVATAIAELSVTYGATSKVVISASIQLADVLLESVKQATGSVIGSNFGSVLVVNPAAPASGNNTNNALSVVTQQQATVGVAEAEQVLHDILQKVLPSPEKFASELSTVVSKLLTIAQIYSMHPVAKKEHAAAHYLSDVLPAALGEHHPLVATAYNATKHYYVQLAKKRADRIAAATALHTAGKFACLALASRVATPDIEDELDSLLTVMSDDILKVLRAGTAADRKASEELFAQCRQILLDSSYRTNSVMQQRILSMEEIFKTQLKVMEQSEALSRLSKRIDDARTKMLQLSHSIKRHKNRVDLYGKQCLQGIKDTYADIVTVCSNVNESDILHKMQNLEDLFVELSKSGPHSLEDGAVDEASEGSPWDALMTSVGKPTGSPKRDDGVPRVTAESQPGQSDGSADNADETSRGAVVNGKFSRVYVSPYTILGGAPSDLDDAHSDAVVPGAAQARATAASANRKVRPSHRESQKPASLTPAAQFYLQSLSPSDSSQSDAFAKRPQTVEHLAALMPKIAHSFGSRNYNPIRSYAEQKQAASKK